MKRTVTASEDGITLLTLLKGREKLSSRTIKSLKFREGGIKVNGEEVTVKTYIDGDTTHFYVPTSVSENGLLKARYLAVNTPESTGKIEEYGKKASNFTKEKLSQATSIIIESDNSTWNPDSTGDRYLVWVWYKTADMEEYRNLNVEILQNGLAIANNSSNNQYGRFCSSAIDQAKALLGELSACLMFELLHELVAEFHHFMHTCPPFPSENASNADIIDCQVSVLDVDCLCAGIAD